MRGRLLPHLQFRVAHLRVHVELRARRAVHDPQFFDGLLVVLGQIIVRGIGVAEFRLPAGVRQLDRPQQGGQIGVGLQGAIEVPEQRAFQVIGLFIDALVQGDFVNAAFPFAVDEIAQGSGDSHLLFIVDIKTAEKYHAALFQHVAYSSSPREPLSRVSISVLISLPTRGVQVADLLVAMMCLLVRSSTQARQNGIRRMFHARLFPELHRQRHRDQ